MTNYTIQKINFRGDGLAIGPNGRIRIANALENETVIAEDVSVERKKQAYLQEVITPSHVRVKPLCRQYHDCAACQFQCMNNDAQNDLKFRHWMQLLQRFIQIPESCNIQYKHAHKTLEYRHRTETRVLGNVLGIMPRHDACEYYQRRNIIIRPIELKNCILHAPEVNHWINRIQVLLPELNFTKNTIINFEANYQSNDDNARITISCMPEFTGSTRAAALKLSHAYPNLSIIFQELPPRGSHVWPRPEQISGSPWYHYDTDDLNQKLYALKGAWTPVNPPNAHLIRETLKEFMIPSESLLEIGCGCGTHTSVFCPSCTHYTGIDASWPAIQSAQYNAQIHEWNHADFYTDTAEHYLDKRYYKGIRADIIVMHSNRMPYSAKTAEYCKRFGARTLLIVGPTAYALAMECKHFMALGYTLKDLILCNTLPMTYHMMGAAKLVLN